MAIMTNTPEQYYPLQYQARMQQAYQQSMNQYGLGDMLAAQPSKDNNSDDSDKLLLLEEEGE